MDKATASRAGEGGEDAIEMGRHRADEGPQERRGERGEGVLGPANKFEVSCEPSPREIASRSITSCALSGQEGVPISSRDPVARR